MYDTLMCLVGVHAQVTAAAPPLLERTLHALIEQLFATALQCFQQVSRFSMGGMLTVRTPSLRTPSADGSMFAGHA
jgi:exocyst complex component 2